MSTLVVDELFPGVIFNQPVKIFRNMSIAHVRPWIYKHGTIQDGSLQLTVLDGATTLKVITISATTINTNIPGTFAHGYMKFDFDLLQLNVPETATEKEYIFRFEMINHSLDANNFMGIVRQYELKIYPTFGDGVIDGEAPNDMVEPNGLEIYEYIGN